jgi:hypothetical protein
MRRSLPDQGYQLDLHPAAPPHEHHFCGGHEIAGATCPNCAKPLLRMLDLDLRDPRLALQGLGLPRLPLLFCWTCNWAQDVSAYRLRADGGIDVLRCQSGGVETDFPYAGYPIAFAGGRVDLRPVPAALAAVLRARNEDPAAEVEVPDDLREAWEQAGGTHQVGGEAWFWQGPPEASCPLCGRAMAFVATVGDPTFAGGSFAGNCCVQTIFMLCPDDAVVATTQQCD